MGRMTFWIWLGASFVAALAIYGLQVVPNTREVEESASRVEALADRARTVSAEAPGTKSLESMKIAQKEADEALAHLTRTFADRDRANLDFWFPELKVRWDQEPKREDFVRFYSINSDTVRREAQQLLKKFSIDGVSIQMIEYPWSNGRGELPPMADLRRLQREFHIQERIIRAFARHGAYLSRPIRGGESQAAVGGTANTPRFDRIRYDVKVLAPTSELSAVLNALAGPFQVTHENNDSSLMALPVVIDNVSLRRMNVDGAAAASFTHEPPVEVNFFLSVVDLQQENS